MISSSREAHARGELFVFQQNLQAWLIGDTGPGAVAAGMDVAEFLCWHRREKESAPKEERQRPTRIRR